MIYQLNVRGVFCSPGITIFILLLLALLYFSHTIKKTRHMMRVRFTWIKMQLKVGDNMRFILYLNCEKFLHVQPGIRGVACINSNGKVQLRSQKATSTKAPDMPIGSGLVKGNTVISTGIKDGVTFCKFTRTLTVPTGSEDYMYDLSNTNRFAVLASGMVASGEPQYHGFSNDYRIASQSPINIRAFKVIYMLYISYPKYSRGRRTKIQRLWSHFIDIITPLWVHVRARVRE